MEKLPGELRFDDVMAAVWGDSEEPRDYAERIMRSALVTAALEDTSLDNTHEDFVRIAAETVRVFLRRNERRATSAAVDAADAARLGAIETRLSAMWKAWKIANASRLNDVSGDRGRAGRMHGLCYAIEDRAAAIAEELLVRAER